MLALTSPWDGLVLRVAMVLPSAVLGLVTTLVKVLRLVVTCVSLLIFYLQALLRLTAVLMNRCDVCLQWLCLMVLDLGVRGVSLLWRHVVRCLQVLWVVVVLWLRLDVSVFLGLVLLGWVLVVKASKKDVLWLVSLDVLVMVRLIRWWVGRCLSCRLLVR